MKNDGLNFLRIKEAQKVLKKTVATKNRLVAAKKYWNLEAKNMEDATNKALCLARAEGIQIAINYVEDILNALPRRLYNEYAQKADTETG